MTRRTPLKDYLWESHLFTSRAVVALVCVTLLLFAVVARLVYLQVISHEHFSTLSENNRVNIVPIPPNRGLVYDRNGVLLAQNMPSFSLELVPEQVQDMETTLAELAQMVTIDEADLQRFRIRLAQKHPFESIPLRLRLSDEEVARFAVNRHRYPGVDIQARLTRDYPLGMAVAHAVGYVGRINESELQQVDTSNYRGTNHIGKIGVERFYEGILHGEVGYQHVETNASGRVLRVLEQTSPRPGYDLYLSLDMALQNVAEEALAQRRGAVVAISPKSGEVLALVSLPTYDPNLFVNGISAAQYQELQNSPNQPLFNRALNGQYPPGSTIKPLVGLAGLEYQEVTPDNSTFCPGWYSLPGSQHRFRDWKRGGHGHTDLRTAIIRSCDVYFYNLSLTLGIDRIHKYLSHFGLGTRTGIDLPGEPTGLLPSREWKRATRRQAWFPGETLIAGIGQGYNLTTPLQLALATATLANRGAIMRPQMLHASRMPGSDTTTAQQPVVAGQVPVASPANWDTVIGAMQDVVHSPRGTAHAISQGMTYHMAGKTGTAQVFGIAQDAKYEAEEIEERLRDHALFVGFAPLEDPQIAVAVIVENGGHGGSVAAPVAKAIIDRYMADKAPAL